MKKIFLLMIIALFALLSGCGKSGSPTTTPGKGSLTLTISQAKLNTKTIQPNLDMTIATYDITGTGPGGTNFQRNNVTPGSQVTINALAVGPWTIEVDAKNPAGVMIASGVSNVTIIQGSDNTALINVLPLTGTGELNVTISWPAGIITNPAVTGILTPVGGTDSNITFTLAEDGLSATYQNNVLPAGYYTLKVQLRDGPVVKWGAIESVRIIAGQTSSGAFPLTANPGQIGSIQLVINPDLQNPIVINFSGQQATLPVGTNMTVTATTNQDPVDSYQWYLNGTLLPDKTGPSITLGSSLSEGSYRLDLVVVKGNISGSQTHTFEVGGSGNGNVSYHHQPIPSDYMPRIPTALSENSAANNWEMAPQLVSNFNSWIDHLTSDMTVLKNVTGPCIFRGLNLTYETGTNLDADPNYTVKMTMTDGGGALRALFFCNNDQSRWRHIVFSEGTSTGEIREVRYVNDGTVAHIVLLIDRMNIAQLNDVIEIWHYSDEEQIKSIRVYKDSSPDVILNFAADVNLATGKHHTTAVINASYRGPEITLGYFNDDDLFVDENVANPNPSLYPSSGQAENVFNTNGITPEIVGNIIIDENLSSNFYQLYPNL